MPLKKAKDIRKMTAEERHASLEELRKELLYERGVASMGGAPANPGKIRALRMSIARHLTVETEIKRSAEKKEEK